MAVDQALGGRLEFGEHGRVIHIRPSSGGSRPQDLHVPVLPDTVGTRQSLAKDIAAVEHHYLDPVLNWQIPGGWRLGKRVTYHRTSGLSAIGRPRVHASVFG